MGPANSFKAFFQIWFVLTYLLHVKAFGNSASTRILLLNCLTSAETPSALAQPNFCRNNFIKLEAQKKLLNSSIKVTQICKLWMQNFLNGSLPIPFWITASKTHETYIAFNSSMLVAKCCLKNYEKVVL